MRSLTLNVYGIEDGAVQDFVCSPPASSYFTELAIGMTEQCQARRLGCRLTRSDVAGLKVLTTGQSGEDWPAPCPPTTARLRGAILNSWVAVNPRSRHQQRQRRCQRPTTDRQPTLTQTTFVACRTVTEGQT